MAIGRRGVLLSGLALAGLAGMRASKAAEPMPGEMIGAGAVRGHSLRDGALKRVPNRHERCDVAIIGAGIAGLAAGYRLKNGPDIRILELEDRPGGNSDFGQNAVSAYPWAAHYLPIPGPELEPIRQLLAEFGALTGYDAAGRPLYDETMLVTDPDERLFFGGKWQSGLLPAVPRGSDADRQQRKFHDHVDELSDRHGPDGRRLFALPVDDSSIAPEIRALDQMSFSTWLDQNGYTAPGLRWLTDYGCRDDFGTPATACSAWAGLHYFASRDGTAGNAEPGTYLTWPEGNGWLMQRLAAPNRDRIQCGSIVYAVGEDQGGVVIDYHLPKTGESVRLHAKAAIMAVPRFIAARLVSGLSADGFHYAPWAVANITLDRLPEGRGVDLAWDNVGFGRAQLGYVVATHQALRYTPGPTVVTCYWPLTHLPPAESRHEALSRPLAEWQRLFTDELLFLNPDLRGAISRCDVRLFGHAMIRPEPGFIWGEARRAAMQPRPPLYFAHSDLSGLSLFETASLSGFSAADAVLKQLAGQP